MYPSHSSLETVSLSFRLIDFFIVVVIPWPRCEHSGEQHLFYVHWVRDRWTTERKNDIHLFLSVMSSRKMSFLGDWDEDGSRAACLWWAICSRAFKLFRSILSPRRPSFLPHPRYPCRRFHTPNSSHVFSYSGPVFLACNYTVLSFSSILCLMVFLYPRSKFLRALPTDTLALSSAIFTKHALMVVVLWITRVLEQEQEPTKYFPT